MNMLVKSHNNKLVSIHKWSFLPGSAFFLRGVGSTLSPSYRLYEPEAAGFSAAAYREYAFLSR